MRQPGLIYATLRHKDRDKLVVIEGTFYIHSISYFALLDNRSIHSYVASIVTGGLEIPVENTEVAFSVHLHMGTPVEVNKVYKNCPLELHDKIFLANLMELPFGYFDLILRMDWLSAHRANLDCDLKRATLKTYDKCEVVLIRERRGQSDNVKDKIRVVRELSNVFLEELHGVPPKRKEIKFDIEVYIGSAPVSMAPYKMTPKEHKKLKV
ncbi:uncharacterized protein LOC120209369 [Hibiscus syriacus]|uniref:uncharacterized protein LOC120209369 n=1 Tax=Hibiscus syriacus TaxID=106335 RepID=UPI0019220ECA|nr:uncharacterized protein LOC120209369 [Hibiscus syriacus]